MSNLRTKDLTAGSPLKLMLSFMLPLLFGMLFQQFYNMVDTIVVGNILGVDALAGVGSTGSVNFLVLGLCNGICAGFAIPVAQKFGEKDLAGLRRFVGNMIWLAVIVAVAATLTTTVLCRQILTWMNTPAEAFRYAYDYLFVVFLGIPAAMLYNLLSGILRSLGNSKTPLIFLIISSLLNVGLDLMFILVFRMGVAGAGLATLISQLVSGVLCLFYIVRKFPILRLSREDLRLDGFHVKRLLSMGLPMGLQYSITAIGTILVQTAVNGLGPVAMAAVTAASKVGSFCFCPFDAMGSTAATFAGQNVGAGKPERVHQGVKELSLLGCAYSVAMFLVLFFWGHDLTLLFLDTQDPAVTAQVLPLSRQYLLIISALRIPQMLVNILRFTIQGMGFSELAVFAGVFELVARSAVALGLIPVIGFLGVCFSDPSAWIMADLFLIPAYFACLKKCGYRPRYRKEKASACQTMQN